MILRCPVCKSLFNFIPGNPIQLWCDDCIRGETHIADVIPLRSEA